MTFLDSLYDQKVMVTGASGFLGSHLSRRLVENGIEVEAVSRSIRISQTNYLRWWQGDMTDIAAVRHLLDTIRPDVIFHLSGLATGIPDFDLVLPTFHSLLTSTVNILAVATEIGCRRIVLAASLTEPEPSYVEVTPTSPYAAAKWACGGYGRMFYKLYRTPVVMVRPFMAYGPGQDTRKLIPYVTLSLLQREVPKLSSGNWQADWIYVDDVIEGFLQAAEAVNIEGCTIDLGSGELASVRTIVQYIVKHVGNEIEPIFGALPDRPLEKARIANVADAYSKLCWKPLISLEQGLEQTVDWYRKNLQIPESQPGQ